MASKELTNENMSQVAEEAFKEAIEIINSAPDGWKEEKANTRGDRVMSKKSRKGKKIYRIKAVVNVKPDKLIRVMEDTSQLTKWNTTLLKHEHIKDISDKVKLSYQVTTEGGGGVVSSRDFLLLLKTDYLGDCFVQAGCSVDYPFPKDPKLVRAWNGPGGIMVRPIPGEPDKCEFIWLLDCDYRGWIPTSILELAMPIAQLQFVECVHNLAKTLQ